jgi:hypothetical protein
MFLITRPNHDDVVYYLSAWSKELVDLAIKKGRKVIDLKDNKANKKRVTGTLRKKPVKFVMFNGHGDNNLIAGHKNEVLIETSTNVNLLKDKIIYCRSCNSAKELGPNSIDAGAIAFIGYENEFIFVYDTKYITKPLKDKTAALFLNPTNKIVSSILKGNTVQYSYEKSQEIFKQNISKLLSSTASDDNRELLRYLIWDYNTQVYHGDSKAKY